MRPTNAAWFFLAALLLYGGVNIYLAKRLFQCMAAALPRVNVPVFAGVYAFIALSLFLSLIPLPSAVKDAMRGLGSYWAGFFIYSLMFFIAADAAITACRLWKIIPSPIPPGIRLYAGLVAISLTLALIIYGAINANHLRITSYDVSLRGKSLPGGMKIELVSDLHLGATGSEKRLEKTVAAINEQKPDLVCMAGDIFNDSYPAVRDPERVSLLFKSISATHGVYACLGNHDGGKTLGEMTALLQRSNVNLLNDDYVVIDGRIALIGRLDGRPIGGFGGMRRGDISGMMESIDKSLPIIVMDHNPKSIHSYQNGSADLVLSGHTHRGQLFPANLITKAIYAADYGRYQKEAGSPILIVTSGAGTWGPPMRVGTFCEVASISVSTTR
ncbi:MAG: metallophosphoesterase [Chitinispirillales bacterium]|jgi:predicted MPP superfamily phosphohydrolase|nr:metallophosphoesterase [Chitinispirillales bacterium]